MPRNLIGGIATILIGLGYLAMSFQIRASALDDSVGPAGFPKALAVAADRPGADPLRAVALGIAGSEIGGIRGPAASGTDLHGELRGGAQGILRAAGMLALGIGYLLILRPLGYVPSIALADHRRCALPRHAFLAGASSRSARPGPSSTGWSSSGSSGFRSRPGCSPAFSPRSRPGAWKR